MCAFVLGFIEICKKQSEICIPYLVSLDYIEIAGRENTNTLRPDDITE